MPQVAQVAIIGGGLSGLACSWFLTKKGIYHDLYERSPHFGGRARQIDKIGQNFIDNGQHLISDRYTYLKSLLDAVNPTWREQTQAFYPWEIRTKSGKRYLLGRCSTSLSWKSLLQLFRWIYLHPDLLPPKSSQLYLQFIEPFSLSVFALEPCKVGSTRLSHTVRKFVLNPKLYLPTVSLSQLIINPLVEKISQYPFANLSTLQPINTIYQQGQKFTLVSKKEKKSYDSVIFSLPPDALQSFFKDMPVVQTSPITTIYEKVADEKTNSIIINPIKGAEWQFILGNKKITVSSNDSGLLDLDRQTSADSHLKSVRMKKAVACVNCPNLQLLRQTLDRYPGSFIGDWLSQQWPSTLEAAVETAYEVVRTFGKGPRS